MTGAPLVFIPRPGLCWTSTRGWLLRWRTTKERTALLGLLQASWRGLGSTSICRGSRARRSTTSMYDPPPPPHRPIVDVALTVTVKWRLYISLGTFSLGGIFCSLLFCDAGRARGFCFCLLRLSGIIIVSIDPSMPRSLCVSRIAFVSFRQTAAARVPCHRESKPCQKKQHGVPLPRGRRRPHPSWDSNSTAREEDQGVYGGGRRVRLFVVRVGPGAAERVSKLGGVSM